MLYVIVEGGIVTGVCSDNPTQVGETVTVVDYDTEGAADEDVVLIEQSGGEPARAYVGTHTIELLDVPIPSGR